MNSILCKLLGVCGLTPMTHPAPYADIVKWLDDHRRYVELLDQQCCPFELPLWQLDHLASHDDFLMQICYLVHRVWAHGDEMYMEEISGKFGFVRQRPPVLGSPRIPGIHFDLDKNFHM